MTKSDGRQSRATDDEIERWFAGRLPDGWFGGSLEVTTDRDEIMVVGTIQPRAR